MPLSPSRRLYLPGLLLILATPALAKDNDGETAADRLTMRSGHLILGQIIEPSPRGMVEITVRRAWAEKEVPELLKRWDADQISRDRKARDQRKARLEKWKQQRTRQAEGDDPIVEYIDTQLARLAEPDADQAAKRPPLLVVSLKKGEVKAVVRRPKASAKLLRLAWQCGFASSETAKLSDLKQSLEGRGFDLSQTDDPSISDLLPLPLETEDQWLARRAATEVLHDTGLAFLEVGPMFMPDIISDQARRLGGAPIPLNAQAMAGFPKLEIGGTTSPADRFREVSARGRVGAVVTRQETNANLDASLVEMTLWVRRSDGRWTPQGVVSSSVKASDIKDAEARQPAGGFQSQASFTFQSFGFGSNGTSQSNQSHPKLGAAQQKAQDQTRSQFDSRLKSLALPISSK